MTHRDDMNRSELLRVLGVDELFLCELEEEEIVHADEHGHFDGSAAERVRVCWTLHHELGVNTAGIEVALRLLDRIQMERHQFHRILDKTAP